jgi:hypothetical protein
MSSSRRFILVYSTVCFPQNNMRLILGEIVHYSPYNGKVLPGYMYAGTGFTFQHC